MNSQPSVILVTGATGFLGRHLLPILEDRYESARIVGVSRRDADLTQGGAAEALLDKVRPDVVVHLAAYSGGIGANAAYPADFYRINVLLQAHMFEAAAHADVQRLVYPIGGCSYPAEATSPISEDQMWDGYPQMESAGYSATKKLGIVASTSYRTQYGLNSVVIVPGNLYGEYDNFREKESHVIPAMVRRYYEAKRESRPAVEMWGTGRATRDFVYAGDVAAAIPEFIERHEVHGPVNLSSGTRTSIRELAETIRDLMEYAGDIRWDPAKPEGQLDKIFATEVMTDLGISMPTPLRDGLASTITWFRDHYEDRTDGIRL